jgi:transposase
MHLEPHHSTEELAGLARRDRGRPNWIKFRALALAAEGRAAEAIASALGCCARSVQKWVARYNAGGVEALGRRPGQGRKPKFPAAEHARLRARIEAGPTPEDGVCAFHGPDVRRIVRDEFGVALSEQAVYDLLHRLGLSSLMPRPVHRKADPAAQEAFKKKPPTTSPRSRRPTPASGSRSGSRTRRGSASRGR